MPLIQPTTGRTLDIEDRLRTLLAIDTTLAGRFHIPIRGVTPDKVEADEDVVVALFTADEDFSPETLESTRTAPRFILSISIAEPGATTQAQIEATRRRLVSLTTLFRDAVWKYRGDPTPGDRLWWGIKFKQNPTTVYQREPQVQWVSKTQFDVLTQKDNS